MKKKVRKIKIVPKDSFYPIYACAECLIEVSPSSRFCENCGKKFLKSKK